MRKNYTCKRCGNKMTGKDYGLEFCSGCVRTGMNKKTPYGHGRKRPVDFSKQVNLGKIKLKVV